jgi:hypothetical protein
LSGSSPLTCLVWEPLLVAYATASIALGFMWPHKPHHYVKVGITSGGYSDIVRGNGLLQGEKRNLTFLKVPNSACPTLYPLGCRQGSQEGNMIRIRLIRQHRKDPGYLGTALWRNSNKRRRLRLGGSFRLLLNWV